MFTLMLNKDICCSKLLSANCVSDKEICCSKLLSANCVSEICLSMCLYVSLSVCLSAFLSDHVVAGYPHIPTVCKTALF